jgi:hypothetical protein
MKNVTYDAYINNPAIRDRLEREARRLRGETVQAGLRAIYRAMTRRTPVPKFRTA